MNLTVLGIAQGTFLQRPILEQNRRNWTTPDGNTVSFRYYLLGGDTAAPSGLLARLCHTFLVYLSFLIISRRQIISRFAGPILAIFTSNESLLGDTMAPSGLLATLCRAFLVFFIFFFNDFSETNYLKIRWTDFSNLYIE